MDESFMSLGQLCEIVHDELRHGWPNGDIKIEIGKWKMSHHEHSHYVVDIYIAGVLRKDFSSSDGDLKTQLRGWTAQRELLFKEF